jgi:hypothetical protein
VPEGKYLIFYRVDSEIVKILGVPHASMDIERHLVDGKFVCHASLCEQIIRNIA